MIVLPTSPTFTETIPRTEESAAPSSSISRQYETVSTSPAASRLPAVDQRAELGPRAVVVPDQLELRQREAILRGRRHAHALDRVRVHPLHPPRRGDQRRARRVLAREIEQPDDVVALRESVVVERVLRV